MRDPAAPQPRALFVANDPPGRAVYRYRCENLANVLRASGWSVDVAFVGDRRVRVDHDVVVLHRICAGPEGDAYARAARDSGATLVYGADDLVWDADAFPKDAVWNRLRLFAPRHAAMLGRADAAMVSTEFLAGKIRPQFPGKPVWTIRNFLSDDLLQRSREAAALRKSSLGAAEQRVTFGYLSGSATHDADLATIAAPLAETLRRFPNSEMLVVGPVRIPDALQADDIAPRIRRHSFVDWTDLPALISRSVDVVLAPLDLSSTLAHGKSEIKLLEAAALGVPTIASASAGFREALAGNPQAGCLADDETAWRMALAAFAGEPGATRQAGEVAAAYVREHGTASAHRGDITGAFGKLADLPHAQPSHRRASVVGHPLAPRYLAKAALRKWVHKL